MNAATNTGENSCYEGDTTTTGPVCTDTVTTRVGKPSASLTKSSTVEDINKNGVFRDTGDTILCTFTMKNTGNPAVESAKQSDHLLQVEGLRVLCRLSRCGQVDHLRGS